MLDGCRDRLKHQHDMLAWAAWHGAWLAAYAPKESRNFPPLKTLLSGSDKPASAPDWRRSLAAWTAWLKPEK